MSVGTKKFSLWISRPWPAKNKAMSPGSIALSTASNGSFMARRDWFAAMLRELRLPSSCAQTDTLSPQLIRPCHRSRSRSRCNRRRHATDGFCSSNIDRKSLRTHARNCAQMRRFHGQILRCCTAASKSP
jgi:hypothetical protein